MKKLVSVIIVFITILTITMPVMAAPNAVRTIFKKDEAACKDLWLSVYRGNIREYKNEEWAECDCMCLCFCNQLYHVLENKKDDDFYSEFFNNHLVNQHGKVYSDCSMSMNKTFSYEKSLILKNLQPFLQKEGKEIKEVFKNPKTNLYGFLNSFHKEKLPKENTVTMPKKVPIIITDLWEIQGKKVLTYDGEIVFCVPYASTNKDGVLHCESVVNEILTDHSWLFNTSIYVVYIDKVIVEYSDTFYNGESGNIEIYVP